MAANTAPIFALTPNNGKTSISSSNVFRDGSGSFYDLITAGSNGGRCDWIKFTNAQSASAASSGMVVRVFMTDSGGLNPQLLVEGAFAAGTPSNTAIGSWGCFDFINGVYMTAAATTNIGINGGVILDANKTIKVTQSIYAGVQDKNSITSKYGDF